MQRNLTFVTSNKNKFIEAKNILNSDFLKLTNKNFPIEEIQGKALDIVKDKCDKAFNHFKSPVFVDDVSLCFQALGDMPGPFIKYFIDSMKLEDIVKMLSPFEDKSAKAVCLVAFKDKKESEPIVVEGVVEGKITFPKGNRFGWDPIFKPNGTDKTYAQMTLQEKNSKSHRRLALDKLCDHLRQNWRFDKN